MIKNRILYYKKQKNIRDSGKLTGLPLYTIFPKLGEYLPILPKEIYLQIIAGTSVGKTQIWKYIMFRSIVLYIENPDLGFKPFYYVNLLEESKEEFIDSIVTMSIFYKTNKKISKLKLNSFTNKSISNEEIGLVEKYEEFIDKVLSRIDISEIGNPTGFYKYLKLESNKRGVHYYHSVRKEDRDTLGIIDNTDLVKIDKTERIKYKYLHYKPNDPEEHVFTVVDHIALFSKETINGVPMSHHETLSYWSYNYVRSDISKKWKWTPIDIVQCTVYGEEKTFSNRGDIVWEALKPGLHSIGNNKEIARNAHICIMLFNPHRYSLNGEIDGYDLERMEGCYRSILLRKNRIGRDQLEIPLYFDGEVSFFKEMPYPDKIKDLNIAYDKIANNKSVYYT